MSRKRPLRTKNSTRNSDAASNLTGLRRGTLALRTGGMESTQTKLAKAGGPSVMPRFGAWRGGGNTFPIWTPETLYSMIASR